MPAFLADVTQQPVNIKASETVTSKPPANQGAGRVRDAYPLDHIQLPLRAEPWSWNQIALGGRHPPLTIETQATARYDDMKMGIALQIAAQRVQDLTTYQF
jgi:hypothetical protein